MNTASTRGPRDPERERFGVDRLVAVMVLAFGGIELVHQILSHKPWGPVPTVALVLTTFAAYSLLRASLHERRRRSRRGSADS